ncbi:MAG: hypothetical protein AAGF99_01890 [Bacteroidota bacterium]
MGFQVLQDYAVSLIVGGGVILMLLGIQTGTQQSSIDAAFRYDANQKSYGLTDVLDRDLTNIGLDGPAQPAILSFDWTGATPSFEFVTLGDTTVSAASARVRYQLQTVSSTLCADGTRPCYQLTRYVHDGTAYQIAYTSPPTITGLSISPMPATGTLDDIRTLDVTLQMETPNTGTPVTWDRVLTPPNLALR